jgi:PAS domain S-box-containing protein
MLPGPDAGTAVLLGGLLAVVLLLGVTVVLLVRALSRRSGTSDVRRLVSSLEDLRGGHYVSRPELEPGSELTVVADAIHRAAHDVKHRLSESAADKKRLELVMDTLQDSAVVTIDVDGDIRDFDESAERMLGWTADEVRARSSAMIFEEEAFERLVPQLSRSASPEEESVSRTVLRRKDGGTLPAELRVRALDGDRRDGGGFLILLRDVSRQARLEEELRQSEERYRRLVEGLTDGVAIVRRGVFLYVNPAFGAMTGVAVPDLVGKPLRDRVATRELLMVEERLSALERERDGRDELRCTLVGEHDRPRADVRVQAATIEFERERAVLLLVHDETASRRIERELRNNESQLDAVLEATSDGMIVVIEQPHGGVIQMTNRALLRILGLRQTQVLGQPTSDLIDTLEERGGGASAIAELLASGAAEAKGIPVRLAGTHPRDLTLYAHVLVDRDARRIGRVIVCRDTTRQREAERKLQEHAERLQLGNVELERALGDLDRANRNLAERGDELDRLNRELQRLDELRQKLMGNLSHELQAPLVAIRGYTEMTLKERLGPVTEEQRKGLTLSLNNIDRLIALIDGLTKAPDLTDLDLSTFPLRTLIEESVDLLHREMEAKGVHFALRMEDGSLRVHADRDKIGQVLINVLSNAVKFNRDGGSIEVTARPGELGYVDVAVRDTGVGIPVEELGRIFDRHYRGEESARGRPGRGLGLSIVREILAQHGCRVRAESEPGEWTRIRFNLPLSSDTGPEPPTDTSGDEQDAAELETRPPEELAETTADDGVVAEQEPEESRPKPRFRIIRRQRRR